MMIYIKNRDKKTALMIQCSFFPSYPIESAT